MRTEHTMQRTRLLLLPALVLAGLAAAPAAAQVGNQSDISGPYSNGPFGAGMRTENELFGRAGDVVVFRNARIGCALRGAERAYRDSVANAPLTPSQERVLTLLGAHAGTPSADAVAAALARGAAPDTPLGQAARTLADALSGLMRDRGGCSSSREAYEEAGQWQQAIEAFKRYVHDAPDAALSPPAPELVAIHAALQAVIDSALRSPGAR